MNRRNLLLAGVGAAAASASALITQRIHHHNAAEANDKAGFPNPLLTTHEGREVRFYDDLLKDKVVGINFMYAQCSGICPGMTANLIRVQHALGERVGRDIFLYSFTLQPELDTPAALKDYASRHHTGAGWAFLTGKPEDLERIRRRLGFFDPDPVVDRDKSKHTGLLRYGNVALDRWGACPALATPEQIARSLLWMVPTTDEQAA